MVGETSSEVTRRMNDMPILNLWDMLLTIFTSGLDSVLLTVPVHQDIGLVDMMQGFVDTGIPLIFVFIGTVFDLSLVFIFMGLQMMINGAILLFDVPKFLQRFKFW